MMLSPHVLKTVTQPRQRLGMTENALPIPLILSGGIFLFFGVLSAVIAWIILHSVMVIVCWMEPYCMQVIRGRRAYPKTKRHFKTGGNIYGA